MTEHGATFAVRPGVDALRPPQRTPVDGLFLAGDWTATGWPATMEGAVRSGYLAAEGILARPRPPRDAGPPRARHRAPGPLAPRAVARMTRYVILLGSCHTCILIDTGREAPR